MEEFVSVRTLYRSGRNTVIANVLLTAKTVSPTPLSICTSSDSTALGSEGVKTVLLSPAESKVKYL